MSDFTKASEYEKVFNPRLYLETYFRLGSGSLADDFMRFVLRNLHKTLCLDGLSGHTVIDIGTCPSIYQLLSACESYKEIIATWYTQTERQELQKWLNKDPDAFDWSSVVKHVCDLEGNSGKSAEKEDKLRGKIKQVLHCDVSKSNPLEPVVLPQVDCLISTVCLEAACRNHDSYATALKNLANLLKPEGHLLLAGDLGANFYEVGEHKIFSLSVSETTLRKAFGESGFVIREFACFGKPEDADYDTSDYEGFFFIHAQKP